MENRSVTYIDDLVSSHEVDQSDSDQIYQGVIVVQHFVINFSIILLGIVTNTLNMFVFLKLGFQETINISLFGLAVSDLCSLITLQMISISFSPFLKTEDISFVPLDVIYLVAGWPRMAFTRISAWITAFITFERCICIALPLKVRTLITARATAAIILTIYISMLASVTPTYYTSRLSWKFTPERNRTILSLSFTPDRQIVDSLTFLVCSVCLPVLSFTAVVICTIVLSVKLNRKTKWREMSVKAADGVTLKDKKVIKMVNFISIIFIACFIPNVILFMAMVFEPELSVNGKYKNIFLVVGGLSFCLESINSSINIFVYYRMSSKFRETFNTLFCHRKTQGY